MSIITKEDIANIVAAIKEVVDDAIGNANLGSDSSWGGYYGGEAQLKKVLENIFLREKE